MSGRLRSRVAGPLAPFATGFAGELTAQGYTTLSATMQLRLMAHLSRWMTSEGVDVPRLDDAHVGRFLRARRASGYVHYLTPLALRPLIHYLRRLGAIAPPVAAVPSGPVDVLLDGYRRYLMEERRLHPRTVRRYLGAAQPFLCTRLLRGAQLDLAHLSARDVTAYVAARCPHQSQSNAAWTVAALRSLLGYLHVAGRIPRSLSKAVPSPCCWRLAGLPKALEASQVQRLLQSCDRRTRIGRRDFAILSLLARLGLRAGEVAALCLEDIDWRGGEIVVHGKGNRTERLPLPTDVGEALAAYLRHGRPHGALGRALFVRRYAPLGRLSSGGISHVVLAASQRAGLPEIRAHRLRHTVATQMLHAGVPMPEIGQVLRHCRASTTAIYAKVDREALRSIARVWSGGVA